jgi:hypothetical protein
MSPSRLREGRKNLGLRQQVLSFCWKGYGLNILALPLDACASSLPQAGGRQFVHAEKLPLDKLVSATLYDKEMQPNHNRFLRPPYQ